MTPSRILLISIGPLNEGPLLEEDFNYDYVTPPSQDTVITLMATNPPKSKPIRLPNGTLSMPDTLTKALQGEEPEYEVEKIVGKSIWSGNGRGPNGGRRTKYLIKWVGYDEPQWEFAESGNLANCQEFIDDYERANTL